MDALKDISFEVRQLISINEKIQSSRAARCAAQ